MLMYSGFCWPQKWIAVRLQKVYADVFWLLLALEVASSQIAEGLC